VDYYGRVQFQTTIPASSDATCQTGGTGWTLSLDPLTGAGPTYSVFDISGNSTFGTADLQTFTSGGTSYTMYVGGVQSGSGAAPPPIQIKQPSTCNGNRCYGDYYTGSNGNLTSNSMSAGTASQRDAWREVPNDQ
jgi:type IV pilus assembly protein PilY1